MNKLTYEQQTKLIKMKLWADVYAAMIAKGKDSLGAALAADRAMDTFDQGFSK